MNDVNSLTAVRLEKRAALEAAGLRPYGGAVPVSGDVGDVRAAFAEGKAVSVAGRVTARRDMGKSHFLDVSDHSGRLQVYLQDKAIGEDGIALYDRLDIGDFIGVEGECFTTKTGEPSVKATRFVILSKSLHQLPEKWHGLQDIEARHRQRYLDLISNEHARDIFRKRFAIIREIRTFFEERGFLEVETPMMQAVAGGAAATPFETHHNALGLDLYLRIAPELYLKRLLVGGFTKVFELNRNFRNEGVSRRHNPEFTMLEAYWAYADFEMMAELVEDLVCRVAERVCGGLKIEHKDAEGNVTRVINLQRPWRRARYRDLVEGAEPGWFARDASARRTRALELGLDISHCVEEDFISHCAVNAPCAYVGIKVVMDQCRLKVAASGRKDRPEYPWDGCAICQESSGNGKPSNAGIVAERSGESKRSASITETCQRELCGVWKFIAHAQKVLGTASSSVGRGVSEVDAQKMNWSAPSGIGIPTRSRKRTQ